MRTDGPESAYQAVDSLDVPAILHALHFCDNHA
jgi:hypothetical protein